MSTHPPKPHGWFTVKEACAYLGLDPRTLYRRIDSGNIPAYQMGRVIRLRQHELDAYIEACRIAPGSLSAD